MYLFIAVLGTEIQYFSLHYWEPQIGVPADMINRYQNIGLQ